LSAARARRRTVVDSPPRKREPLAGMEVSPTARLAGTGLGFGLLYLAGPGILTAGGVWPLAPLGLALWARYASRPGRWALGIEGLTGGLAWAGITSWVVHVWPGILAIMGPGHGVYMAATGWVLRRFAKRWPLALSVPLAWMLLETVRAVLEPPFGLPWMRLGTHLHDQVWIAGSARVWGSGGLSLALAAAAGALADLARARWPVGKRSDGARRLPLLAAALGFAPLAAGVALALAVPPPATVDGPRVLLVQPAFEQERKQDSLAAGEMMREQVELTSRGLAEAAAAGEPAPDLVCWGETMLRVPVVDDALAQRIAEGARWDPWRLQEPTEGLAERLEQIERSWVDGLVFGRCLSAGTSFASGAEYLTAIDGRLRWKNSVFVWPGPGEPRRGPASKRHLVPGAETMLGLERFAWVRDVIFGLARYVPDFAGSGDDDPVLSFTARDGRTFRFGVAVCFDNAFDDVFTRPVREADADFHLVVSNEAWFRKSQETDQMVAFSRLAAIATGRSVVRATNSGISVVLAPDGSEVERLTVGGEDREVRGTLRATVPIPAGAASSPAATPFVRFESAWTALWLAVPALALLAAARRGR
jgi:apolipoprotein N-acyltransferase